MPSSEALALGKLLAGERGLGGLLLATVAAAALTVLATALAGKAARGTLAGAPARGVAVALVATLAALARRLIGCVLLRLLGRGGILPESALVEGLRGHGGGL